MLQADAALILVGQRDMDSTILTCHHLCRADAAQLFQFIRQSANAAALMNCRYILQVRRGFAQLF